MVLWVDGRAGSDSSKVSALGDWKRKTICGVREDRKKVGIGKGGWQWTSFWASFRYCLAIQTLWTVDICQVREVKVRSTGLRTINKGTKEAKMLAERKHLCLAALLKGTLWTQWAIGISWAIWSTRFSTPALQTIIHDSGGVCFMYYWMLSRISDLGLLGARSKLLPLPLAVKIKSVCRHCQIQFCL